MTTEVVSAPTTSWDIRIACDTPDCKRSVSITTSAVSQTAAVEKVRAHVSCHDGWTSEQTPVGEGRGRGFNTVDRCRRCANQKAGWQ